MKKQLLRFVLLFVCALFLLQPLVSGVPGSGEGQEDEVDAKSEASRHWEAPPYGYTYKVVLITGIDGYVIQYNDKLYRGRTPSASGLQRLKDFGLNTLITLHPDKEMEAAAKKVGLKVLHYELDEAIMPGEKVEAFLKMIKESPGGYYIHSGEKRQRAGILAAIYRLHIQEWAYDKTIIEYGRLGGSLKDHDRLLRGLKFSLKKKKENK